MPSSALAGYGTRDATRSSRRQLAIRHLGLRPFVPDDMGTAIDLAARAAFHSDEGRIILIGLINDMKRCDLCFRALPHWNASVWPGGRGPAGFRPRRSTMPWTGPRHTR